MNGDAPEPGRVAAATSGRAPVTKRGQRGPNDPHRRDRIARAAVAVIARYGIDSLTHRKVAAMAGVALGSTTYYFGSLEELIAAALDRAARTGVAQLQDWADGLGDDEDPASALADFVIESVGERREQTLAEYSLYVLALHRPHLQQAVAEWDNALSDVLVALTDQPTGRLLGALLCGTLMQAVLHQETPGEQEIREIFRRAIAGPASTAR